MKNNDAVKSRTAAIGIATRLPGYQAILRLLSICVCMFAGSTCFAQIPIHHDVAKPLRPDSIDSLIYYGKKHFWRASAEVVGFNLGLWSYDRFIQHGDFAYISFNTIKENFKVGFKWDNDKLGTNTFLHPYNGSLYFNAGRANGFNFWQSELYAIAGSGMWEMFMECEYPSTNDFIATPIGGAALGELFFRASDAVIDERAVGAERFEREAAAFILSPMRGFNRIVTGQAWRVRATSGRVFGTPRFALRVSAGLKALEYGGHLRNTKVGFAARIDAEYGDRFEVSHRPYDYFTARVELQGMKSQPFLSQLEIRGRLLAREILESKNCRANIGFYQHFDFYDSDTLRGAEKVPYKLGIPACLGLGVMFRGVERHRCVFDAYLHANGIALGSILSDHYFTDERNYNWASGFSVKGGINMVFRKDLMSMSLKHAYYRLFTWHGYTEGTDLSTVNYRTLNVQGDASVAQFNVTEARVDLKVYQRLYATIAYSHYLRSTYYRDFPHVHSKSSALQLMLTYKF